MTNEAETPMRDLDLPELDDVAGGAEGLAKTGTGHLLLANNNTYTGTTRVLEGAIIAI